MTITVIKCPFCECTEQTCIGVIGELGSRRKVTYHCPVCKKEWSEMKGFKTVGRYYWHHTGDNREHRRILDGVKKVKVLGGCNTWD